MVVICLRFKFRRGHVLGAPWPSGREGGRGLATLAVKRGHVLVASMTTMIDSNCLPSKVSVDNPTHIYMVPVQASDLHSNCCHLMEYL